MIQSTLAFSTKFNVVPTTPKFVLTDLSPYSVEGISLTSVIGLFKIEGPTGIIYNNTNFGAPDIVASTSLVFGSVSIPLDINGVILTGNYKITYTARISGGVQPGDYTKVTTSYFCYVAPKGNLLVTNSVRLATVTSTDNTSYPIVGINPTLARTHDLFYPSSLVIAPIVSGLSQIVLSYPNVYTGTYTGKVSTIASYVFTDGLLVDYLITAVSETIVDNKTLCDIYCGIKNLTNEMLASRSTGDFGKASHIQETLSLVSILFSLYDDAITCGKESDASNWLNQIITLANITVGCGCVGDQPVQVVPSGGGAGATANVIGDSSTGTQVDAVTVGPTTTYTVRLTSTYKNLILSALQTQDLSVTAFRAAGIPEEARGVQVTPVTSGGGTISLTPGSSKNILVLTGSPTLSSSLAVQTIGSPIDGDSFIVDYRASITPGANTVTIFGLGLTPAQIASGNCLIYTWYSTSSSTWYSKLISNDLGSAVQSGLSFWVTGADFALGTTVLSGTSPSFIYKNIQSGGSGTNAPTGTSSSNTWWQLVGNKSALYDSSNNLVLDVTTGKPFIMPTLNTSASTFNFLVLEGQEIKKRALSTLLLAGTGLNTNKILVGNVSAIATEQDLSTTFLRSAGISGVTGNAYTDIVVSPSGTVTVSSSTSSPSIGIRGTTTLVGAYTIALPSSGQIVGDYYWFDYLAVVSTGGNPLIIGGITLTTAEALAGNIAIYCYWDSVNSVWRSRKITYGVAIPAGTVDQTVRYNSSNVLIADANVIQDVAGNLTALNSIRAGFGNALTGLKAFMGGSQNGGNGNNSLTVGNYNTNNLTNSILGGLGNSFNSGANTLGAGNGNTVNAGNALVVGNGNTVSDNNSITGGSGNTVSGIIKVIGSVNTGVGNANNFIEGDFHNLGTFGAVYVFMSGIYGRAVNSYTKIFASGTGVPGKNQEEKCILFGSTTSATPIVLALNGTTMLFNIQSNAVYNFECKVVGIQSAGALGTIGDSHAFVIKGAIKNLAGTLSLVGTATAYGDFADAAASSWTAVFSIGATSLNLTVTGQASKTIQWSGLLTTINAGY